MVEWTLLPDENRTANRIFFSFKSFKKKFPFSLVQSVVRFQFQLHSTHSIYDIYILMLEEIPATAVALPSLRIASWHVYGVPVILLFFYHGAAHQLIFFFSGFLLLQPVFIFYLFVGYTSGPSHIIVGASLIFCFLFFYMTAPILHV